MEVDLKANAKRYESDKAKWELEYVMQRIHITRNQPRPRVTFKHNEDTGAYIVKEGRGGINWYRYQEKVLKPLLLPFAKRCLELRPSTVVQEDKAPSHNNRYCGRDRSTLPSLEAAASGAQDRCTEIEENCKLR